jgi:hypothetical protein
MFDSDETSVVHNEDQIQNRLLFQTAPYKIKEIKNYLFL